MASGIRDKVAVIGMGCSKFGERWDAGPDELMVEAYLEAMGDAGIEPTQLDAAWFSTHIDEVGAGKGGTPLSIALRLPNTVIMDVVYTEPAIKGDTQSRVMKPAKLQTGVEIPVPIFVATGDKITVNTQTREYTGRVNK